MPARRSTEHRFRKFSRLALTDVPQDQADCAANGGVYPMTRTTEGSLGMIKAKLPDHRSANNSQGRTTECTALGTQNMKIRVQYRFHSGKHHRNIFRLAAGHRTIDCDLLDRRDSFARRNDAERLVRWPFQIVDDRRHFLECRREHGHTIGPALLIGQICERINFLDLVLLRSQFVILQAHDSTPLSPDPDALSTDEASLSIQFVHRMSSFV